jgi:hypothetical protein
MRFTVGAQHITCAAFFKCKGGHCVFNELGTET